MIEFLRVNEKWWVDPDLIIAATTENGQMTVYLRHNSLTQGEGVRVDGLLVTEEYKSEVQKLFGL